MQLCQLVVGQVEHAVTLLGEVCQQFLPGVVQRVRLHPDKQARFLAGVVAIVELGDLALAQRLAEGPEAAWLLGDGHGNDRLALLTQLGTLGHMAQAVEVDVGTGVDRHQRLPPCAFAGHVLLDASDRQRAGRLGDRAGIVVDVLDCRAQLIAADGHHLIDEMPAQFKTVRTDLGDRHAIGEGTYLRQDNPLPRNHGGLQAIGVVRLDADHLDLGAQVLHVRGDPCHQATAPDRHEDGIQRTRLLAEDLHADRALPGDHVGVIVRWHEGSAFAVGQGQCMGQGVGEAFTVQHHMPTPRTYTFDFQRRRGGRHDDGRLDAQMGGRQCHTLGVVACRCGDHPTLALSRGQARQPGVGTADLERERGLQVFAFEQYLVAQAGGQRRRRLQWGLDGQVVHRRRQDAPYLLRQQLLRGKRGTGADVEAGHRVQLLGCFHVAQESKSRNPPPGRVRCTYALARQTDNGGNNNGVHMRESVHGVGTYPAVPWRVNTWLAVPRAAHRTPCRNPTGTRRHRRRRTRTTPCW
ncbi:hypothetical protein D3C78_585520 [compost metagenome]